MSKSPNSQFHSFQNMIVDKIDTGLCRAFQDMDGPFEVAVWFGGTSVVAFLTKNEICNMSEWEEVVAISLFEAKKERRWRKRDK